jgi:pimeloyl-ACP methyl ester carboxylesterase
MKKGIYLIIILVGFASCLDLDPLLFNPNTDITEYKLDNFTGEQEIDVDAYQVADSLNTIFTIEVGDKKEKIYAVYIGNIDSIQTDTVFLYLHGNAGHMDFYWPRAKLLANVNGQNNYGVLMIDYRGYGLSEGTPSESNLYEDSRAAVSWLADNGLTSDRFMMYGFSLGSAPALELTANGADLSPSKIMLESPFASAEVMVQDGSGLALPSSVLTNLKIDNAEEIKKVTQPLYWVHGIDDDFLALETHGKVVFENHQGAYKVAYKVASANHGDVPKIMGYEAYIKSLEEFIR